MDHLDSASINYRGLNKVTSKDACPLAQNKLYGNNHFDTIYVIGIRFVIITDHKPLEWLQTQKAVYRLWRYRSINSKLFIGKAKKTSTQMYYHCYATIISLYPDMEELRKLQLNDRVIGRVLLELETVSRKEQFTDIHGAIMTLNDSNKFNLSFYCTMEYCYEDIKCNLFKPPQCNSSSRCN